MIRAPRPRDEDRAVCRFSHLAPSVVRHVGEHVWHLVRNQVIDFAAMCGMCGIFLYACARPRTRAPASARTHTRGRLCMPHMPHMAHWRGFQAAQACRTPAVYASHLFFSRACAFFHFTRLRKKEKRRNSRDENRAHCKQGERGRTDKET